MLTCPRCQSPNIASNKPLTDAHLEHATGFAQYLQRFSNRRLSVVAGLGALALQGVNALFKDCWCQDCHYLFDLEGEHGQVR